jgi:hypothetical protein
MSVPPRAGVMSRASLVNPKKEVPQITRLDRRNWRAVIDFTWIGAYGL